ncbi:SagB/ThcOx family dehydrogenase [Thiohalorhabdus sp.]|uniref:SagB/ThcOx family dehydrogenase n=1 Tax=Thiohalorhabdus sp. TaxID=3094134 RepID=UPI002FC3483A
MAPRLGLAGMTLALGLAATGTAQAGSLTLPAPDTGTGLSVTEALDQRHSVRDFREGPISLANAGQILWAAQGTNRPEGRTAPSAGGLYPLTVYLVAGAVADLPAGIYRFLPEGHRLERVAEGDQRDRLARAARGQTWVRGAPAVLVITAVYARTTGKYGNRGRRYVHIEVGHAGQNVYLQAEALGLGTVMVGAFADAAVARILGLEEKAVPLALMPIGRPG